MSAFPTDSEAHAIQTALTTALATVLLPSLHPFTPVPITVLKPSESPTDLPTFTTRITVRLYHHLLSSVVTRTPLDRSGAVPVPIISPTSSPTPFTHCTLLSLAELLLPLFQTSLPTYTISTSHTTFTITPLTSLYPCHLCPSHLPTGKGLWWHLLTVHSIDPSEGKERVRVIDTKSLSNHVLPGVPRKVKKLSDLGKYIEEIMDSYATHGTHPTTLPPSHYTLSSRQPSTIISYLPSFPHPLALTILSLLPPATLTQRQTGNRGFSGRTLLHWTARYGNATLLRHLLTTYELDARERTDDGTSVAHLAAYGGCVECLEVLGEVYGEEWVRGECEDVNEFECDAVLWASQGKLIGGQDVSGDGRILKCFEHLNNSVKASFDGTNRNGHTVFHKLCQRNHPGVLRALVRDFGAYFSDEFVLVADVQGWWPSDLARMEGFDECVEAVRELEMRYRRGKMTTDQPKIPPKEIPPVEGLIDTLD